VSFAEEAILIEDLMAKYTVAHQNKILLT